MATCTQKCAFRVVRKPTCEIEMKTCLLLMSIARGGMVFEAST
jgi:hypothetical protein